jgi:hypothetical protein
MNKKREFSFRIDTLKCIWFILPIFLLSAYFVFIEKNTNELINDFAYAAYWTSSKLLILFTFMYIFVRIITYFGKRYFDKKLKTLPIPSPAQQDD